MKTMKQFVVLLVSTMLFLLVINSLAVAQMGEGNPTPTLYGEGKMMRANNFETMDNRFIGLTENTFIQTCNAFGVSEDDAIYDLDLPNDFDRGMMIGDMEQQYGLNADDIANYMAMHMRGTTSSLNARNMVDMRQQAMQGIRSQGMVNGLQFMKEGGTSYGHYMTYAFGESGEIRDFAISGDAIFDSAKVSDFNYSYESLQGAVARYVGTSSLFLLHDNPTATMQVKALADKTVTFELAESVEAEKLEDSANDTISIKITKANFEGYLIICKDFLAEDSDMSGLDVEITDGIITVELVENSQVMFRATPMEPQYFQTQYQYSEGMSYMHQRINQEVALGKVGAELTIRNQGDTACLLNHTPVNMQVKEAIQNRVVIGVQSEMKEGQVVTINLDGETIDLTNPERIRLQYDGVALERAGNIDELFAGGNKALCYLLQEDDTVSMAVYIPEFSEHEIIIDLEEAETVEEDEPIEEEEEEEPAPTPGFGAAIALGTLAIAYLKRRS
ncbi:MAG TPA: hypothetical protein C5S51_03320 [Methanosarcinaceae archaeon]|nr:hypothetical protein [Methanosarcinaceae archaeon]